MIEKLLVTPLSKWWRSWFQPNAPERTKTPAVTADVAPHSTESAAPLPSTAITANPDFAELIVLLKHAKNGSRSFASYNNLAAREEVVAAVKQAMQPLPVFEWTYTPEVPAPTAYLKQLTPQQEAGRAVVFLFDLERGGEAGWKALDYYREMFAEHPHGIVIWVTQAGRIAAARKAPHFWAQRSMVFDFTIAAQAQHLELLGLWAGLDLSIESYADAVRQLRIYQGLLDDYLALPDAPPRTVADLHRKVALTLNYLDRREEALPHLQELLELADKLGDNNLKAEVLTNLAQVERIRSGAPTAIRLLEQAQSLANSPHLQASICYNLGSALTTQGHPEKSLNLLTKAQQLFEQVGDKLGQANVLLALGRLNNDEQAFTQAIELYERIQDGYSIARGKYYFALALLELGQTERAKTLLMEARTLWSRIDFDAGIQLIDEQLSQMP